MALNLRLPAQLSRRGFLVTLSASSLGACAPEPTYVEPLADLGGTQANSAPLDVPVKAGPTIALVFGSNVDRTLQNKEQLEKLFTAFGPLTNTAGLADSSPQPLITGAVSILRLKYPRLEPVDDLATASRRKFATTIVLDFRAVIKGISGSRTTATVIAIFLDADQKPLSRIEGSGSATVPYPAWTAHFREASDIALRDFTEKAVRLLS